MEQEFDRLHSHINNLKQERQLNIEKVTLKFNVESFITFRGREIDKAQ